MSDPVKARATLEQVTVLFCGDSGDGIQLTGAQLTITSAVYGNDVSTLPDYPSEIRAPAGSLAGVSAFQLQFANHEIHTPGDRPDVLVAMNPASLKGNLPRLQPGGVLINRARMSKFGVELGQITISFMKLDAGTATRSVMGRRSAAADGGEQVRLPGSARTVATPRPSTPNGG